MDITKDSHQQKVTAVAHPTEIISETDINSFSQIENDPSTTSSMHQEASEVLEKIEVNEHKDNHEEALSDIHSDFQQLSGSCVNDFSKEDEVQTSEDVTIVQPTQEEAPLDNNYSFANVPSQAEQTKWDIIEAHSKYWITQYLTTQNVSHLRTAVLGSLALDIKNSEDNSISEVLLKVEQGMMEFCDGIVGKFENFVCFDGTNDMAQLEKFKTKACDRALDHLKDAHEKGNVILKAALSKLYNAFQKENFKIVRTEQTLGQNCVAEIAAGYKSKLAFLVKQRDNDKDNHINIKVVSESYVGALKTCMDSDGKINGVLLKILKGLETLLRKEMREQQILFEKQDGSPMTPIKMEPSLVVHIQPNLNYGVARIPPRGERDWVGIKLEPYNPMPPDMFLKQLKSFVKESEGEEHPIVLFVVPDIFQAHQKQNLTAFAKSTGFLNCYITTESFSIAYAYFERRSKVKSYPQSLKNENYTQFCDHSVPLFLFFEGRNSLRIIVFGVDSQTNDFHPLKLFANVTEIGENLDHSVVHSEEDMSSGLSNVRPLSQELVTATLRRAQDEFRNLCAQANRMDLFNGAVKECVIFANSPESRSAIEDALKDDISLKINDEEGTKDYLVLQGATLRALPVEDIRKILELDSDNNENLHDDGPSGSSSDQKGIPDLSQNKISKVISARQKVLLEKCRRMMLHIDNGTVTFAMDVLKDSVLDQIAGANKIATKSDSSVTLDMLIEMENTLEELMSLYNFPS